MTLATVGDNIFNNILITAQIYFTVYMCFPHIDWYIDSYIASMIDLNSIKWHFYMIYCFLSFRNQIWIF